ANSPKLSMLANWQSVLWHEYCHVVTLNMTRNKIPRWLSEGISVYEETRKNPNWGQKMTPQYRRMILEGELTPVSKLSGAFLNPPSSEYLQFAYFESSMVVAFLVERFGESALKKILFDLGQGTPIHQTLSSHTMPIKKFEKEFEQFIRKQANALAPKMDWGQHPAEEVNPSQPGTITAWLEDHPNSFSALTLQAKIFMSDHQWEDAKKPLKKLIELYPQQSGPDNPYQWLAQVHRHLNETTQEHDVLEKLAHLSSNAFDAYERLTEIAMEQKNWQSVIDHTRRTLGVYPLLPRTYRRSGQAYESLGLVNEAIDSYQRLLMLDSSDPAEINYRLALLLQNKDPDRAKRHVLTALSKAPRYRDAHRLLQKIVSKKPGDATPDQEATE
ncbi:MAG: hypothetical protein IID32_00315, partial [Planctomycetes bacterium]|nr:hypothetical protein [Planctomycetota bacterium]